MATVFENPDGTWNYGTHTYGSHSDAIRAEQKEKAKIAELFSLPSSKSNPSDMKFLIGLGLFALAVYLIFKFWYVFLPIAVIIAAVLIFFQVKKVRNKKVVELLVKANMAYEKNDAIEYFNLVKKVADKYKNPDALYAVSYAYLTGYGIDKNESASYEYLEKSADKDHMYGRYYYGDWICFGKENPSEKELKKALNV